MSEENLKKRLLKVAKEKPQHRKKILTLIKKKEAARTSIPYGQASQMFDEIRGDTKAFLNYMSNLRQIADDLAALVQIAEKGRMDRSEKVTASNVEFDGNVINGQCKSQGENKTTYYPRITLQPSRGFNCQCKDREERGKVVGPCKHVLALGRKFWNDSLQKELDQIDEAMTNLMDELKLFR